MHQILIYKQFTYFRKAQDPPPVHFSFFLFLFFIFCFPLLFLSFIPFPNNRLQFPKKRNQAFSQSFCRTSGLTVLKSASFLAIAEVYKTEGDEAYLKDDYRNAVYFYTEGIKVNCKDVDVKAELYSNRAHANLRLGEARFCDSVRQVN